MRICKKGGGVKIGQIRSPSQFWIFFDFLTPTEGVDHFYSTLGTCLASVGIMESRLTSGIPSLLAKNGQKGPKLAYLDEVDFGRF